MRDMTIDNRDLAPETYVLPRDATGGWRDLRSSQTRRIPAGGRRLTLHRAPNTPRCASNSLERYAAAIRLVDPQDLLHSDNGSPPPPLLLNTHRKNGQSPP